MTQETTTQNPLALCGVKDSPNSITYALQELQRFGPVVAPGGALVCSGLAEGYAGVVTCITPDREVGRPGGDLYKDKSSGQICFSAKFLAKLAAGLGIEWDADKTRRLDAFQHPYVCSLVVGGRYRDYTGEIREISASHTLDLRDEAAHGRTDKELPRARKYIHQLCETMAQSRAIAKCGIDRTIHQNDLGRPISMVKVYRRDAVPGAAETARGALYGDRGETIDRETGEVHTVADAEVRDADTPGRDVTPPHERGEGAALVVPSNPQYGADQGKAVALASDATLVALANNLAGFLDDKVAKERNPGLVGHAERLNDAVADEMERRAANARPAF